MRNWETCSLCNKNSGDSQNNIIKAFLLFLKLSYSIITNMMPWPQAAHIVPKAPESLILWKKCSENLCYSIRKQKRVGTSRSPNLYTKKLALWRAFSYTIKIVTFENWIIKFMSLNNLNICISSINT